MTQVFYENQQCLKNDSKKSHFTSDKNETFFEIV